MNASMSLASNRGETDLAVDAEFVGEALNRYPDDPLNSENVDSRRARIRTLYDQLDYNGQGYLEIDSIVKWLDQTAFDNPPQSHPSHSAVQAILNTGASSTSSQLPLSSASSASSVAQRTADTCARGAMENIPLGSTFMYARELVKVCDKTADGRITFAEFEAFVKEKEKELLKLFQEVIPENGLSTIIDTGNDNVIHLSELLESVRAAGVYSDDDDDKEEGYWVHLEFTCFDILSISSGIDVSESELQQFIDHVDKGNDGVIDFFEWRDYLLLLPQKTTLKNVFKFYNTTPTVELNADADAVPLPDVISISGLALRLQYFLCGGVAGAISRTVTAPLDRLKVLLQTQTYQPKTSYLDFLIESVRKIYKDGGIMSFYRGNGLNILKIFPESALKFFVFEYSKDIIRSMSSNPEAEDSLGVGGRFIAGGIAGLVSQFAIYPIEITKTRMMSQITNGAPHKLARLQLTGQLHKDSTISATVRHMWAEGGLRAFYRGCIPALVGIVPYAGIDLAVFETLKQSYISWSRAQNYQDFPIGSTPHLSTPIILLFGMMSGTCGAVLVYPLSLVRTRLQAQGTPSHPTFYKNSFDVIRKTVAKEGFFGFYKGLTPTLFKVLPAVSISYWVYEKSKRALDLP
ncbi:hypothetical protein BSLG_006822 [Batrachochytrium salamandrivorans]|nr:hypothetical protein BSLG_006822 [Batrachochytrium salamandrivorans]